MPLHRLNARVVLASSLSVLLLSGCPNAGTQPPVGASSPTASPADATGSPAATASQAPAGTSGSPAVTPSTGPIRTATLRGKVYDETGATVNGASVSVRSLNASNPFESKVDVVSGSYVVNSVPAGVQLEITATKAGWTSRTRVESLLDSTGDTNVVNFGGQSTDASDPEGAPYFVSDYPEITSAVPTRTDAKLTYVVRLSEPLDTTNQRRFENALTISAPHPDGGIISLGKGATFLDDRVQAKMTWDETGSVLTYEFEAPLLAKKSDETRYTLRLVRGTNDALIEDTTGKRLGYLDTAPESTYSEVFKLSAPAAPSTGTPEEYWKAAHTGTATFDVPEDDKRPTLVSVTGIPITSDGAKFRFSLTFSEPMKVYPDETGYAASVLDPANYRFVLGEDDLNGVDMDANPITVSDATQAQAAMDANSVFRFDATGTPAKVEVSFSTTDPKVVYVTVDRALVPTDAKFFKVRVDNVEDPARNVVATGNENAADQTADNIKMGAI